MSRREIDNFLSTINIFLNGLTAAEMIYGGRLEYLSSENPTTDLLQGKIKFHLYYSPVIPAESIEIVMEYDVSYLQAMFS